MNVSPTPITVPIAVGADGDVVTITVAPEAMVEAESAAGAAAEQARIVAELSVAEAGELPIWSEWTIAVPPSLAAIEVPTELVALTDNGALHRVEFPSGRVRSISLGTAGVDGQVVVTDDAIVVYSSRLLTVVRDDAPIDQIEIADGVIFVQGWPGTDRFVVTTAASSGDSPSSSSSSNATARWCPSRTERSTTTCSGPGASSRRVRWWSTVPAVCMRSHPTRRYGA